jgi:cathepsin B
MSGITSFGSIVDIVNTANATWVAGPVDRSVETFKSMCGTWLPGHPKYVKTDLPEYPVDENAVFDDSLDWRAKAPQCTVISKIRDQSACGSCWAFGSTETFEDRRCIATKTDQEFSSLDTAGCCEGFACGMSQGCNGGQPTAALHWMSKTGIVTGGDFYDISKEPSAGCKPYPLQPCAHHVPATSKYPACPSSEYSVSCKKSSYTKSYSEDKTKGGTVSTPSSPAAMITALEKGPLSVAFTVYADFPTYKTGVYKHTSGSALGGHAVEVIGYGTEDSTDYWLVKNSWNEQWGDGGCFKIVRGTNECGIEDEAAAIDF